MAGCSNDLVDASHRPCGHAAQQVELVGFLTDIHLDTEYEWKVGAGVGARVELWPNETADHYREGAGTVTIYSTA